MDVVVGDDEEERGADCQDRGGDDDEVDGVLGEVREFIDAEKGESQTSNINENVSVSM
jgi:hypothetical protein